MATGKSDSAAGVGPHRAMIFPNVEKRKLPWIPEEEDKPCQVKSQADRIGRQETVREGELEEVQLVHVEVQKPVVLHRVKFLKRCEIPPAEMCVPPAPKTVELFEAKMIKPEVSNIRDREIAITRVVAKVVEPIERQSPGVERKIDHVRAPLVLPVMKEKQYVEEDE